MTATNIQFNERERLSALASLSLGGRVAFAASCATRLLPAYSRFSVEAGRGDPQAVQSIASRLWSDLKGETMSDQNLRLVVDQCEDLIPGENQEPWIASQAYADDAVSALAYALRCRISSDPQDAVWASRRALDAVDSFVCNVLMPGVETSDIYKNVQSHPLVQAELERQRRDLAELAEMTNENFTQRIVSFEQRAVDESNDVFGAVDVPVAPRPID